MDTNKLNFSHQKLFIIVFALCFASNLKAQDTSLQNSYLLLGLKSKQIKVENEEVTLITAFIEVPENRSNPDSKLIQLPVVIYKSTNANPQDPVFRLAGGPGETNIPKKVTNAGLLKNHDFVFVGYRGVDGSTKLKSKKLTKALKGINHQLLSDASLDNVEQAAYEYLISLQNEDTDINGYTIIEVIEDIEYVRKAMGHEKINILSSSYGTRVALIYSYKYPEAIHRTVMNGANPPDHFLWFPEKTEVILDKWESIYITHGQGSVKEAMNLALKNMPQKWMFFKLDKDKIKTGTYVFLFSTDMAVMAFDAFNRAAYHDDYSGLFALQKAYNFFLPKITWGDMFQKGFSADFNPEIDYREYLRSFEKSTILGANYALLLWGSSGSWQSKSIPEEYRKLRQSSTETLILSGELDVSTPVDFTIEKLLPTLKNAHHIVLQNMSHSDVARKQPDNYKKTINEFFLSGIAINFYEPQTIDFKPKSKLSRIAKWGLPVLIFF